MHNRWLRLICRTCTQSAALVVSDFDVVVSIWFLCITTLAEVLSDRDGNVVKEKPARGEAALKAHDNPEAISRWQQTGRDADRQSRGMERVHTWLCLDGS